MTKKEMLELSVTETNELRELWNQQQSSLPYNDYLFVKVRLSRDKAKFTKNQLYKTMMNLAGSGLEKIPSWMLDAFDNQ